MLTPQITIDKDGSLEITLANNNNNNNKSLMICFTKTEKYSKILQPTQTDEIFVVDLQNEEDTVKIVIPRTLKNELFHDAILSYISYNQLKIYETNTEGTLLFESAAANEKHFNEDVTTIKKYAYKEDNVENKYEARIQQLIKTMADNIPITVSKLSVSDGVQSFDVSRTSKKIIINLI